MKFRTDNLSIDPNAPFANDALNRKPLVEFLEAVIEKAEGPLVLALDSPWGTGKTTLVKMLQAQLEAKQFRCIYFNAWAVDYASDPLLALVSKIDLVRKNATPEFKNRLKKLKSIAALVGKRGLIAAIKASTLGALDLEKEIEAVLTQGTGDITSDIFDLAIKESECLSKFREELEVVIGELQNGKLKRNLVFFIDELDRCRPNFAIELLERVKHLFDVPNIVFVLSVDKSQLEVSTASVYGTGINTREYLRRFIDLEFQIPQVSGKPYINHLLTRFGLDEVFSKRDQQLSADKSTFIDTFSYLAKTTGMSLRTQEHCIARLALVLDQTPANYYIFPVLAATLIATRAIHPQLFSQIRSGTASTEELMNWLRSLDTSNPLRDRPAMTIASYMNAADPDESRMTARRQKLQAQTIDMNLDAEERKYSSEVLQFTSHLRGAFHGAPDLAYVMNKMELAENIRS